MDATRERLKERCLSGRTSEKSKPALLQATKRWVERTNSWQNAHRKLVWCTERRVIFWVAFSDVISNQEANTKSLGRYR